MDKRAVWVLALVLALAAGLAVFDWNWLKGPVERYVQARTHRRLDIDRLDVRLGANPVVRLDGVRFGNAAWADVPTMASIDRLEFSVSLVRLFTGRVLLPRVALTGADISLEKQADGRRNWLIAPPSERSESVFEVSSLSVSRGHLRYRDEDLRFALDVRAETLDALAGERAGTADAASRNDAYRTRFTFEGRFREGRFAGSALTGEVLSFQKSGVSFPFKGELRASTTRLQAEGHLADAADPSAIDVRLDISGQTLASLYPFLQLPFPASPPYRLAGHLTLAGGEYRFDDIRGVVGSTDVRGSGSWAPGPSRPMLQAQIDSDQLVVSDLGPLVGMQTKESGGSAKPAPSEVATRPRAKATERRSSGDRVLPAGRFEGERLRAIDADFVLRARRLKLTADLPLESLQAQARLRDGRLSIAPLRFGVAGGQVDGTIALDAGGPHLRSDVDVRASGIELSRLTPRALAGSGPARQGGRLGASLRLVGEGDSVADAAGAADGSLALVMADAQVSNLLDAMSGLNGGKALTLLLGGDRTIPVRCGAIAFDVKNGQARATTLAIDTEQTQVTGSGTFSLRDERLDLRIAPLPKEAGFLSLRTPIHVEGSFRNPTFRLEKAPLALRAGGMLALAALTPAAALLALVEPGPGQDLDCAATVRDAARHGARAASRHRNAAAAR